MPEEEDDDADSSDSDRRSKMSFSYWGADKITIRKPPPVKARGPSAAATTTNRKGSLTPLGYSRESSANAKFGTRLVSPDSPLHHHAHLRPATGASRRTANATPASRRPNNSEDGHATVTRSREAAAAAAANGNGNGSLTARGERPAWDGSTRPGTTTPISARTRPRNLSHSSAVGTRPSNTKLLASPAPSEDSGVGLYRQLMAADSQLNV